MEKNTELKAKIYNKDLNVYQAAMQRIAKVFEMHDKIVVSLSGGKDSVVLMYLVLEEAIKRDRKIYLFWLDQEYEYTSTFNLIDELMKDGHVIPIWFQIPGILPHFFGTNFQQQASAGRIGRSRCLTQVPI